MKPASSWIVTLVVLVYVLAIAPLIASFNTTFKTLPGTSSKRLTLIWSDEFDGDVINESTWNFNIGNGCPHLCFWGNNELQYYKKENAFVENGYLIIEARRENVVDPTTGRTHEYTSARLDTISKFKVMYGRIEVRAKLPSGKGLWPAIWMLGEEWTLENAKAWPSCGEIDIVELIGSDPATIHGTVHAPFCYGARGVTSHFSLPKGRSFSDDFYVFAVEWTSEYIAWFVDDQLYHVVTRKEMELRGCKWVFDKPFHIIINVAVGGYWPGPPDSTTPFPVRMYVDYVRVYSVEPSSIISKLDEPDNEILARVRGFPKGVTEEKVINWDFSEPVTLANMEFLNPDDWYLRVASPDLLDLDNTGVVNGVLEIRLRYPPSGRVALAQYIWLYQGRTYVIELRVWSTCKAYFGLQLRLPVETREPYLNLRLEAMSNPRTYRVPYEHGLYRGNVVELAVTLLDSECEGNTVFYVDYVNLLPVENTTEIGERIIMVEEQLTPAETPITTPTRETLNSAEDVSKDQLHDIPFYVAFVVMSILIALFVAVKLRRVVKP